MKIVRTLGSVAIAGALLTLVSVGTAAAEDTTATFTLDPLGGLGVAVQGTATLTAAASGTTSVTGTLGEVLVTDARGGTAGWVVSASSSEFVGAATPQTVSTGVDYTSGTVTTTGVVTVAPGTDVDITAVTPVQVAAGTLVTGNNTATYNPTLTVTLPTSALATTYSGTVTTSVA